MELNRETCSQTPGRCPRPKKRYRGTTITQSVLLAFRTGFFCFSHKRPVINPGFGPLGFRLGTRCFRFWIFPLHFRLCGNGGFSPWEGGLFPPLFVYPGAGGYSCLGVFGTHWEGFLCGFPRS